MKKRYLTLLALLLSAGLAAPACGGDDDDDNQTQDDDDDNQQGAGGGGNQQGSGGGGNQQGSGGGGNQQGSGGGGNQGNAGNAGNNGGGKAIGELYELKNGDIADDEDKIFPFGVAIANDGAVFVSTLGVFIDGDDDSVPSRIYRFAAGNADAPTLFFEAGNGNAVYGMGVGPNNRLYACVAAHANRGFGADASRLYEFSNTAAPPAGQSAAFDRFDLSARVTIVNGNQNDLGVGNTLDMQQCGNIAFDNKNNVYVTDITGGSQAIFRYNPTEAADDDDDDDNANGIAEFNEATVAAWTVDANLGAGNGTLFGASGVTVVGNSLFFIRQDDDATIFRIGINSNGLPADNVPVAINFAVGNTVDQPVALATDGTNIFVAEFNGQRVTKLENINVAPEVDTLVDDNDIDQNQFANPTAIAVQGTKALVVGSQLQILVDNQEAAVGTDPFRVYRFDL